MRKKKLPSNISCVTCFYAIPTTPEPVMQYPRMLCRRNPKHIRITSTDTKGIKHWCGDYLDEITGKDLVPRPEDKTT